MRRNKFKIPNAGWNADADGIGLDADAQLWYFVASDSWNKKNLFLR
jgi:hypothetical protein